EKYPSQALLDLINLLAVFRIPLTKLSDLLFCALFFCLKRKLLLLERPYSLCENLDLLRRQGQCSLCLDPFTFKDLCLSLYLHSGQRQYFLCSDPFALGGLSGGLQEGTMLHGGLSG